MKHENTTGSSRPALTLKTLISGVALSALLGLSLNVQAQTCTTANWDATTNVGPANTGTQGANNRRYGGPCGLRVAVDGTERVVTDNSPTAESTYIARFYAFLNNAGANPIIIYAADDGAADQVQVWYNFPNAGDLTLRVFDQAAAPNDLSFTSVGSGWHSIEFVWESAASADIRFAVNSDDPGDDLTATINTSGITLAAAHLGNVNAAAGGTSIDFDDFDSRRISRPGRLLLGDADNNGILDIFDSIALRDELEEISFAPGQPDCDENGAVDIFDALCLRDLVL